jgi:formate hydrogenlyase subunit 3/multisubunit Na+/H+ antiporter MnhD subunit
MLDIKIPIGLMFSIFGVILLVYGFITRNDAALYQKSLSHNVNLWMGGLTLLFGVIMLLLVKKGNPRDKRD